MQTQSPAPFRYILFGNTPLCCKGTWPMSMPKSLQIFDYIQLHEINGPNISSESPWCKTYFSPTIIIVMYSTAFIESRHKSSHNYRTHISICTTDFVIHNLFNILNSIRLQLLSWQHMIRRTLASRPLKQSYKASGLHTHMSSYRRFYNSAKLPQDNSGQRKDISVTWTTKNSLLHDNQKHHWKFSV